MPSWTEHVMWWHVYPLGAVGAPIRAASGDSPLGGPDQPVVHRLGRLEAWLDHVLDLGLNGLLLGPVFASATHGYDTIDHRRIDPRLGDDADLDRLVAAAHGRGIRVLLDGVFNHVGRTHPAFQQVEAEGPDAATASLFRIDWNGWSPGDPVRADVFEGHEALVALDHDSAAVVDWVADVMDHWLGRGVDGWRLDAAYAVPSAFWAQVLPRVREQHPDAWFLGEVIHGDAARVVHESTIDSLTAYELWQGIWHGIADRNLFELAHAVERHAALLETSVPATFVGNHDVTRIASAVGADLVPHALAVLFTVGGVPSVYAGDEDGATGVKEERLGGDDAVRPELAATPPREDDLDETARRTRQVHQQLIGLRRREPWLASARADVVHTANEQLVLRSGRDDAAVVVALNLADEEVTLPCADATEVLVGAGEVDHAAQQVRLGPRGWAVLHR